MPELNQIVADRMKSSLTSLHLSVKDYATRAGQSYEAAKRRINGDIPLTLTDLQDFCAVTGYRPCELLEDEFVLKPSSALAGKGVK
ncbi:hypothetical protein [Bifidobacterium parmae]|uniref:XRE family transcriptional regulator n=1 Tax=Bifidobacterium parmae TaxID=361854 RepID=A0A2N5IVL1_9BIFI|nr:hypothetical protein [Bifidobacterium parmae]PLS26001.1 hypothetical protein Uis4E_2176 [Bifidobacterium parmae]